MVPQYEILVEGSSVAFQGGFFGISTIVLIRSGATLALFDCGHGVTRKLLLDALQHRGLAPKDIDLVILSHGHFDHVLNLDLFPEVPVVLSRDEYDYIQAPFESDWVTPRLLPMLLEGRELRLTAGEEEILPGVTAFPTPGHAPGHISLELPSPEGPVVLAADALKTAREASTGIPDLEFDPEKRGKKSLQDVLRRGRIIVPGHFPTIRTDEDGRISWTGIQEMPLLFR
ncbi:MBL fold metallo-hydrolase [Roseibium salinum]|uniref:MBL fold metallo-hydrolase n=1 Tax=Roseibium salinum TaxID=1604349 RepID=A0ABT3QWD9_9HYPH|nr:MBL fold metallo-hydrolase [Roseibium sp. DSM 29163]MCX2721166.1 MBL fold metallo-hydrolase [Roseibium sp. DSM 29163]